MGIVLPPGPETAAIFFGVWKSGAILLSIQVLMATIRSGTDSYDSGRSSSSRMR